MSTVKDNIKQIIKNNININWCSDTLTEKDFNDYNLINFITELATTIAKYDAKIKHSDGNIINGININGKYICSDILYELLDTPRFNVKQGLINL